jgi:hypothetical protein
MEPNDHSVAAWIRCGVALIAAANTAVGGWAALSPHGFYAHLFPGLGGDWVSSMGPYDEHLVRDLGEALLAIAVLLWTAAGVGERRLVRVALAVALVQSVPHLAYHLTTTGRLDPLPGITSLASLAVLVVVPAVLLAATGRR